MARILDSVQNNDIRMLKLLLAVPQSLSQRDLGQGLFLSAKLGHTECLNCLLQAGCDITSEDVHGNTPLYVSVMSNRAAATKLLLEANSSVNARGNGKNTPLHVAAKMGYDDCLEMLVSRGASVNARDSDGCTALIHAVKNKQYNALRLLLESSCNVNQADKQGRTALHHAAQRAMAIEQLLAFGADPNICDIDNNTPLLLAATEGFSVVVRLLARANCDVNIANASVRRTPLHILSLKGHADCIDDLIEAGADVNLYDKLFHTPLWYAIYNKRFDVVKLLLKANSQVDTFQCSKEVPLEACPTSLALSGRMTDVVKLFILTGFDHAHLRSCLVDCRVSDLFQSEDLEGWLKQANSVLSLKQLCRKWIRHHLGRMLMHNLNSLPIPEGLRDFVFLKELDDHRSSH
ncbi:ankyrin repeat, PH and SEC7 domain containing protein secG-like [Gigantopelta aegis]|uniref:ankyrin repeat, PH and SEC7 domain containing protein secG-like n=1 Tax=Gigantopelta aegis TaxID=1735272 RepID=UPI001B88D7B0|nr:ankyrin repeat, PH and SEC7 domain containing protein secG-like [Gigantopelta aegis]